MKVLIKSEMDTAEFGKKLGSLLRGGECIELIGDVGAGKTTLTKSIAGALGIDGPVQSPTFTICNRYETPDGLTLAHYDFYRLGEAGVMSEELDETLHDPKTITIVEWGDIVASVLSPNRLTIHIKALSETSREMIIEGKGRAASLERALV